MKNWKKYLALLTALLLIVAFAACTSAEEEPSDSPAEQTEANTETPTEASTEAPTEETTEEADYSAYMGNWYSGGVTLTVQEENKWDMADDNEIFMTGHFVVNENGSLTLYDVEGVEAANMLLEKEGTIYAELYTEELCNRVEDFTFTREESGDTGLNEIVDTEAEEGINEEIVSEEIQEPEE